MLQLDQIVPVLAKVQVLLLECRKVRSSFWDHKKPGQEPPMLRYQVGTEKPFLLSVQRLGGFLSVGTLVIGEVVVEWLPPLLEGLYRATVEEFPWVVSSPTLCISVEVEVVALTKNWLVLV